MLNRFLVSVLCSMGAVKPKLCILNEKSIISHPSGGYLVTWPGTLEPQKFDRVVIRHGCPMDYLSSLFPKLSDACAPLRGRLRDLELTGSLDESTRKYFSAQ